MSNTDTIETETPEAEATEAKVPAAKTPKPCRCFSEWNEDLQAYESCGQVVFGKREFKPGHDAKFKSVLLKAFRAEEPFVYIDGDERVEAEPMELARARGWEHFMTAKPAKKSKAKKADAEVENTDIEYVEPDEVAGFQPASFKIGRTTYDGSVVRHNDDGTIEVSYQDRKGNRQSATLAAEKVTLG